LLMLICSWTELTDGSAPLPRLPSSYTSEATHQYLRNSTNWDHHLF
jgi:hypothetical protein